MSVDPQALVRLANAGDAAAQVALSQALRRAGRAVEADEWLARATGSGHPAALFERGSLRLAGLETAAAASDFSAAAQAGHAPAKSALAALLVSSGDWAACVALLFDAAQAGERVALRELGLLAAMIGRQDQASLLLSHAAQAMDGIAVYSVLARAEGGALTLSEDRGRAYRWALARGGFPISPPGPPAVAADIPPPENLPKPDWDGLTAGLAEQPIGAMSAPETICEGPNVAMARGFMSAEECDYFVAIGAARLAPARVLDPETGIGRQDPIRSNLAAAIAPAWTTPALSCLARRLAQFAGIPIAHAEPPGLLAYRPGQEYRPHFDWLGPGPLRDAGGQRVQTALVYLNDAYRGGQTRFIKPGFAVAAAKGDAITFSNVDAKGEPDPSTQHAGTAVLEGTKFVWSQWYRERPFPVLTL